MIEQIKLEEVTNSIIDNRGKTPPLVSEGIELIETASLVGALKFVNFHKISKSTQAQQNRNRIKTVHSINKNPSHTPSK